METVRASNKTFATARPLPLKQRTSSIDQRRDYTTQTWTSLLGLVKVREYLITVDHFSIWRRHLAWAVEDGKDLREYMTKRFSTSMVFMSLLLSAELSVLFNSAGVTTEVRRALAAEEHTSLSFWVGILLILSAVLTLLSLISTFTAWTMVSAVSDVNAHCILRSSIGQYAVELPGRFIVGSIYAFMLWVILFFFLLLPLGFYSFGLLVIVAGLFVHTITAFSTFGRVIMHSGAMGHQRIFDPDYEMTLRPHSLHDNLLIKAKANLFNNTSIMRQYRTKMEPINRAYSEDELSTHLSARCNRVPAESPSGRTRANSLVKFADGFDTTGQRVAPFSLESTNKMLGKPPHRKPRVEQPNGRGYTKESHDSSIFDAWLTSSADIESPMIDQGAPAAGSPLVSKSLMTPMSILNKKSAAPTPNPISTPSPPITEIHHDLLVSRSNSAVSSLDGMDYDGVAGGDDDERFRQEYGDLYTDYSVSTEEEGNNPNGPILLGLGIENHQQGASENEGLLLNNSSKKQSKYQSFKQQ